MNYNVLQQTINFPLKKQFYEKIIEVKFETNEHVLRFKIYAQIYEFLFLSKVLVCRSCTFISFSSRGRLTKLKDSLKIQLKLNQHKNKLRKKKYRNLQVI